ncbi:putative motility protein [Brevibacillus choshinensis]|uniref:Motility protein n=1 Tax=Brevibacillus choshinensis TaxID=54911 RepID=A0ABX7FN87_BRECH|nr:putative motility protein [Brevibacillus choshinensis]QRG67305.1 putative motility protein [Brevibacillus choshinensis]
MDISSIMGAQVSQLQQTVGLSMLKMTQATQAAGAMVMLQDFANAQVSAQAPHPTLGKQIDISV